MIRHYEAIGLIAESHRTDAGYRQYTPAELHNLQFIKSARSLGFSLDDIRQLLSLWQDKQRERRCENIGSTSSAHAQCENY